ncbi:McrC family protein [Parabacteroides sp. FAFU027]|uniref:McrC family protein n=1 Tax=Parabacteroides sp. FAFU027 TaxID=2922715 RepID=UPI001FAFEB83|nr:McrC family protein [Parabacteroides sp. FAFU027]
MKKASYNICEYGIIRSKEDYGDVENYLLQEIYLPANHFDSLYKYISNNQDDSKDSEKPFTLSAKGRKRQIRVKNYVGVIETKEGLHLEILPKIHLNKSKNEEADTKKIFLRMLRHLKNSPFVNISKAHLETSKDFPILEVFINSYIEEVENKMQHGIKHDYILQEDNISVLKGKLKITENIKRNHSNITHFYCEFSEYSPNISLNRIIKSTLLKLLRLSNNYRNIYSINKILSHLEDVDSSTDIKYDFSKINLSSRLLMNYKTIVEWSEIFLTNKSFTNFKGDNLNMAILFPMEKIFEDYLAYLFKKYSEGYKIKTQDKSYFLVEEHRRDKRFGLRPDIVVDSGVYQKKIIDTKWKLLDEFAERKNYNISQADMYQLYAYGKKYTTESQEPRLVLLYPCNPNFTKKLDHFIYEGDLKLEVIPFNLTKDEKEQIENIIKL